MGDEKKLGRYQRINPHTGLWSDRDNTAGRAIPLLEAPGPYLGVRNERGDRRTVWQKLRDWLRNA